MFQNSKGKKVIILDIGEKVSLSDGIVEDVSMPHPKEAQPGQMLQTMMFGQQQEMVVDLKVTTPSGQRSFRNVPATAVVDKGGTTVITESMELMDAEVKELQRISEEHLAKTPWHEAAIPEYKEIRKKLSPQFAHEQERDETIENLKTQYGELKEQNADIQATQKKILELLEKKS